MMKNFMTGCVLLLMFGATLAAASDRAGIDVFASEDQILSVSRQNQGEAIKTKTLKRELLLSEVLKVLTTYRKVARDQYMIYTHQIGTVGTVTLANGKNYSWSIEPGYAATVTSADGEEIYLLQPELKTEPEAAD